MDPALEAPRVLQAEAPGALGPFDRNLRLENGTVIKRSPPEQQEKQKIG